MVSLVDLSDPPRFLNRWGGGFSVRVSPWCGGGQQAVDPDDLIVGLRSVHLGGSPVFTVKQKRLLVWFVKIGRKKRIGRNDVDEVDMFEGGGGSCCIISIYNHSSNFLSLFSAIWLFNELHYDSDFIVYNSGSHR